MNTTQINHAILSFTFTNDALNSISAAIKMARENLARQNKNTFRIGSLVRFTSQRNGMTYTGDIVKINTKKMVVNTPHGRWNVPANMLQAVV